jgi:hypothetical protein
MLARRQHRLGVRESFVPALGRREGLRLRRPSCNLSNEDNPPRLPAGFQPDESLDDD